MKNKILLVFLLSGLFIGIKGNSLIGLSPNLLITVEKKDTLEVKAEKVVKKSEKLFKDLDESPTKEEILKERVNKIERFMEGLKKLSLPFQKVVIKTALWEAEKICEKTDDIEGAGFATRPQFVIIMTLKDAAIPELIKGFINKNNDTEFRYLCMECFYGPKDSVAVEPLITVMMDSTDKLRGQACTRLGVIKNKRAVEPMIGLYWKGQIRKDVVWSLGRIGDKRAYDVLMDGLENGGNKLKSFCIIALGGIKDKRAVSVLIEMLESKKDIIIENYGSLKPTLMIALGDIGDKRAVPALIKMLKHKDEFFRAEAEEALGKIGDKSALDALIPLAEKGEIDAIKAIGNIGGKRAEEVLKRLKKKFTDSFTQKCIDEGLKNAKNKE